ncbi:MAG: hypothetical protein R3319_00350 [Candidatus Bathyarchaeia archaeon]|nr:hypothetical protein [Candidatus Bathyarchaeia archaeon]
MVELGRGVKAGIVAGLVYGVEYAFLMPLFFSIFSHLLGFQTSVSLWGGYYVQLRVNPFALLIGGPFLGLILGMMYAFIYKWLPGRGARVKSVVFALILWVILALITIATQLPTTLFVSQVEGAQTLQILMTAFAFMFFVGTLGGGLGWGWIKFGPKTS